MKPLSPYSHNDLFHKMSARARKSSILGVRKPQNYGIAKRTQILEPLR